MVFGYFGQVEIDPDLSSVSLNLNSLSYKVTHLSIHNCVNIQVLTYSPWRLTFQSTGASAEDTLVIPDWRKDTPVPVLGHEGMSWKERQTKLQDALEWLRNEIVSNQSYFLKNIFNL